jgi:hypothetical protein
MGIARSTLASLLIVSTLALFVSTLVHWNESKSLTQQFGDGVAVTVGMWLVSIVLAPNVAVWGAGLLVGAPIAVHATQTISVLEGSATKLPPLPILAVFPQQPPGWAWILLLVPVVLTAFVSVMSVAGSADARPQTSIVTQVMSLALMTAVAVAVMTCAISYIASGSLGYPGWPRLGLDWHAPVFAAGLSFVGCALGVWWASRKSMSTHS